MHTQAVVPGPFEQVNQLWRRRSYQAGSSYHPISELAGSSNLASNYGLIRLIRFVSRFTDKLCNVVFLFRLDLNLHAGALIFFWNFELCN